MFFTLEDYRKIEEFLKKNSRKDSDFPSLNPEDPLNENDFIAIVHNGVNHKVNLLNFADFLDSLLTQYKYLTKIEELTEEERQAFAKVDKKLKDLQNQIYDLDEYGVVVSNEFGDNPHISISQKTLTEAMNKLWNKIEDMNGEPHTGIIMSATPDYYVSEEGCDVNITVRAMSTPTEIERIEFYVGDYDTPMLDDEGNPIVFEHVDSQKQFTYHIDDDTLILCKAWILGIEYKDNVEIKRLSEFFLGTCQGGADTDALIENIKEYVIIPENSIDVKDNSNLRVTKDVDCADDDHIVIVVEKSHYNDKILRMDMNGMEIDSTTLILVKNDTEYIAYVSENTFNAGTYNIDING